MYTFILENVILKKLIELTLKEKFHFHIRKRNIKKVNLDDVKVKLLIHIQKPNVKKVI